MNIAIAQLNYHIGNFEKNTEKIISAIQRAKQNKVDLIVFSELCVCGYPPMDLLQQSDFIEKCNESAYTIAQECDGIAAIIGCPTINNNDNEKPLYNSALFLHNKRIANVFHKTLLPSYDIYDEQRYFEQNKTFELLEFKGKKIAITICEDIWNINTTHAPMQEFLKHTPEMIINIAAVPFAHNQEYINPQISQQFSLPIIYVNQVGANAEIIFEGASKVLNAEGKIVCELQKFSEDFATINTEVDFLKQGDVASPYNKIETIHNALIFGIGDFFAKNNFTTATLGLSGGIDSAVALVLLTKAIGSKNIRVLLMPSQFSPDHSIADAKQLAENLGVHYDIVPISPIFTSFRQSLHPLFGDLPFSVTEENIQARIRGLLLMAVSNTFGNVVINTSNKSEIAIGYSTMYGDMNGSISILGDVYKTDVFALAEYINTRKEIIPNNTITKPPSAELRPNQKDSDTLPDYEILDAILFQHIEQNRSLNEIISQGFDSKIVVEILTRIKQSEYKRFQTPPILRVSSKSFGSGRRIPLVTKY